MNVNENESSINIIEDNNILDLPEKEINLSKIEINCLHNIAGYIMNSIKRNKKTCKNACKKQGLINHRLIIIID